LESGELLSITAPFVVILIAFGANGLGIPILRLIGQSKTFLPAERIIFSGLIGATILAGLVWLVGLVRYDAVSMAAVLAFSLAFALVLSRRTAEPAIVLRAILPKGLWLLVPLAILVILFVGVIGSFAPPSDHDTIRYHLYLPERDLLWGRIRVEFGWSIYEFFPPLSTMLTRLVYALGGPVGAQLLNILWQIIAAGTAAALTFRLSRRTDIAWLAALFFLSQRVSINLASAVSVEFVMAAYAGCTVLAAIVFMHRPNIAMGIILGLVIGGLANVKHHGLVYAACVFLPLILISIRRKEYRYPLVMAAVIALLAILPWLIRNWVVTGNPIFPAFHQLFGDNINLFEQILATDKIGSDYLSVAFLPWTIFVNQNKFDGLQFGIPFLLLFLPFAFINRDRRYLYLLAVITTAYFAMWFLVMPNYIRFLVPLFPILCTVAALGAGTIADATRAVKWSRGIILIIVVGLGIAQAGFLTATGIRRIPAALKITSPVEYLESKPFLYYSQYNACNWVTDHLANGEAYLALLNSPTYYCPVARAFPDFLPGDEKTSYKRKGRATPPPQWLGDQLLRCNVRYVIIAKNLGADSETFVFAKHRYDSLISAVLTKISPVYQTPVANVFEGTKVAEALLRQPSTAPIDPMFSAGGLVNDQRCSVTIEGLS